MGGKGLKVVRFLVPAALLYLMLVLLCWATGWCELDLPTSVEQISKSLLALALGAVYNIFHCREFANRQHFDDVNQNLVQKLTEPFSGDARLSRGLSWSQIRSVFYHFVDNDKSLEHQKNLAFANGALWGSAADVRMVSTFGVVLMSLSMLLANLFGSSTFNNANATYVFFVFVLTFLLSALASRLTTRWHMEIGAQQVQHILLHHRQALQDNLLAVGR